MSLLLLLMGLYVPIALVGIVSSLLSNVEEVVVVVVVVGDEVGVIRKFIPEEDTIDKLTIPSKSNHTYMIFWNLSCQLVVYGNKYLRLEVEGRS